MNHQRQRKQEHEHRDQRTARFTEVFVSRGVLTAEQIETLRGWVTEEQDPKSASSSGSGISVPKVSSADMIPGFRLEKKLGAGAMGVVWLARQLSLDRLVAIKLLAAKFAKDRQFIDRFYKEGRAAARLNDPNIVAAYDGFTDRRSIVGVPIGGGPIDIIATPESDQFDYSFPVYSPDGKRMVFERGDSAFIEYYLVFQGRLTGARPDQSLQNPPLVVPTPPASSFGAFGPVWGARPR